jgi:phosphoglycerate kinase
LLEQGAEKILLPVDNMITDKLDFDTRTVGPLKQVISEGFLPGAQGVDIGAESIRLFSSIIEEAKTLVWNGPMGVFEIADTSKGTFSIAEALARATKKGAVSIIGGGDSAAAIENAGLADQVSHVSTGGGASLEFLEGKKLPGVEALSNK